EGIYVPSFYDVSYQETGRISGITRNDPRVPERAKRTWVPALKPDYYPDKPMVPSVEIVQDRLGLEVMRGCTQGCRFCQAGYWYRPVRELDPGDVADMTKKFIAESGWSEVGLLSLSTADYSQIEPLVRCLAPQLSDRRVSISLPSLRAEAFPVGLADAVSEVRKSGFTFAPETGSDRLRRVINKTFTNADMIQAADVAFARGWDLIKVYTMIGLPTETQEDLDELGTLVDRRVARSLHAAWVSGVKFAGWSEHFRYDLWNRAFETEGIAKSAWLRAYDVAEVLPWDVLDASITKRFLKVELVKAKKEMR